VLAGGLGYHVVKTKATTFDLTGGGSFDHDAYTDGTTRTSGELLVGESLVHQLSKNTKLTEAFVFFPNMSDTGEYRFTFDGGTVTQLNKWLSWTITASDRFLSNPLPGVQKNDLLLTTGLQINFGHPPE